MKGKPWSLWGKPAPPKDEMPTWTTYALAEYLDTNVTNVQRWCGRWFGELNKGRNIGRGQGYVIPWNYVYAARAYMNLSAEIEGKVRHEISEALRKSPRDWVAVVDGAATTHYTATEAAERAADAKQVASIIYAGEFKDRIKQ